MKNVYLAQFSTVSLDTYYFFPYSVGLIRSYAQSIPLISKNYDLKPLLWKKLAIDDLVNSLDNPAVFGFSSYVWNANYNLQLAKAVKTSSIHYEVPISYSGRTFEDGKKIKARHSLSVIYI